MKKVLIVKSTGKSVKVGDIMQIGFCKKTEHGTVKSVTSFLLTEKKVRSLLKRGILVEQVFTEGNNYSGVPDDIEYYVEKFLKKVIDLKLPPRQEVGAIFNNLMKYYPMSVVSAVLREVAVELDNRHPGLINKCNDIWIISTMNGDIFNVKTKNIKNFRNFAAFRTKEDAQFARKVLNPLFRKCFKNGEKQKDKECNCNKDRRYNL